jgi:hypothetical protein
MPAYIANHEKKKRIFAKRERELRHAIKHGFSREKLALAAEKLRTAKINVFKCRFAANRPVQPHEFRPEELAAQDRELERWVAMTPEEIIALYETGS